MQRFTPLQDLPVLPRTQDMGILVFSGSCFARHVATYFERALWPVAALPLGPVYQPAALLRQWRWLIHPETEDPMIFKSADGWWRSWLAHHKLSAPDPAMLKEQMLETAAWWKNSVAQAIMVALTLSHPLTFHEKNLGVVANCHKEPAHRFERRLHKLAEISDDLASLLALIRSVNSTAPVILTISPVRNVSLGFMVNFLGKALLRVAIDKMMEEHGQVFYFPAYEIMMDDLRDYRYYAPDMLHPSEQAAGYIAEKFCEAFLAPSALALHQEGSKILARCLHKPMNPRAETSGALEEAHRFAERYWPSFALQNRARMNSLLLHD